ncbi:MAG: ABC transporter substrate-binding protein [Bacillota bacterium]|nr:ABC transporter substrate-binding protein [Bacillota bacterium]
MRVMKRCISMLLALVLIVSAVGCAQAPAEDVEEPDVSEEETAQNEEEQQEEKSQETVNIYPEFVLENTESHVTYLDSRGEEVTVAKKPEKTIILLNSILDLWYMAGGEAIARCDGTMNVPDKAVEIVTLGKFNAISIEKLIELQPDLVVVSSTISSQMEMEDILRDSGIDFAPIDLSESPYESFSKNLFLFSRILGTEEKYLEEINPITEGVEEIINKIKKIEEKPSAIVLFTSPRSVKCELPSSLTGEMIDLLGVENIAADAQIEGANKVDFSLEILVERDPDFIFVTTMGDVNECKERIEKDIKSNEAWNSLAAVKENRVHYLPKDLYLYKPNSRYVEAFEGLVEIVYPEVLNN